MADNIGLVLFLIGILIGSFRAYQYTTGTVKPHAHLFAQMCFVHVIIACLFALMFLSPGLSRNIFGCLALTALGLVLPVWLWWCWQTMKKKTTEDEKAASTALVVIEPTKPTVDPTEKRIIDILNNNKK